MANALLIYASSSRGATLAFIWSHVSGHKMNNKSNMHTLSSVFVLHQLLREISGCLAAMYGVT